MKFDHRPRRPDQDLSKGLQNRKQSINQPMNAGVPPMSHLGPVFFLVFINDLPAAVNILTELFADDALLHYQADKNDSLTYSAVIQADDV